MQLISLRKMDLQKGPSWFGKGFEFGRFAVLALLVAFAAMSLSLTPNASAHNTPSGFADLANRLSPAVVNISTRQNVGGIGKLGGELAPLQRKFGEREASSLGSGFIIDPAGIVITNNHVIRNATTIKVILHDGREFEAKVRGADKETDLAVLEIINTKVRFPSVKWGVSESARVGEWVVAIGNPFGLGGSVSAGIISAINRNIDSGLYDDYIQTDAAINRGNSGGPLFNLKGDVIGVNTAIFSQTGGSVGVGFSIPSDLAKQVTDQLLEFGETRRGWLGVGVKELTIEEARNNGFDRPRGAIVSRVTPQSPADLAGIRPKDIITTFNRRSVNNSRELSRAVAATPVGATVSVALIRDRKRLNLNVTVERRETSLLSDVRGGLPEGLQSSGLTLEEPRAELLQSYGLPVDTTGAIVTAVDPNSEVASILQPGDVIVEIGWEAITGAERAASKLRNLNSEGSAPVPIRIKRGDLLFFETIRP